MGIQPMVECPNCEREFHARAPKQRCPFCKEYIQIVDRIAPGTPARDYDGSGRYPPPPLSIEENPKNRDPLPEPARTPGKVKKSTKSKKSEQKKNRSRKKNGRKIENKIRR